MSIRKILYPLDFTGTATSNRIEGELITVGVDRYRAFTLNFAPFFTSNLTIKERGKTVLLKRGIDYECLYFYPELTKLAAGKEICGVVVVTNATVGTSLEVGYTTVGGHYAHSAALIQSAIDDINIDNRNVYWQNIIDTPTLFQPTPHIHDIGDVYGMEFQIDMLVSIREALLIGDNAVHQQILDRIDSIVFDLTTKLNTHRADQNNPHKTTAAQTGAYTKEQVDALVLSLLNDLAALEPRFQSITTQFTSVTQQFTAVNGTLVSMSNRVGLVEQELSKYNQLLTPINLTLASLQDQIDDINGEIAAQKSKDTSLQTQINNINTSIGTINNKNVEQDDRLDTLKTAVTINTTDIDTNTDDIADLKTAVASAASAAGAANSALANYVLWSATTRDKWDYNNLVGKVAYITPTGSMEIGNSIVFHTISAPDPAVVLTVDSSATVNKSTLNNSGYFNCQDIYVRSDIRDKRDITRLSPAVADDILRKLGSGIRYKLHDETVFTAGLAAQEVLEVFPEAIGTCVNDKGEQRLTMRQNAIIGLLVSGYNKQAAIIESLLAKVDEIAKE